MDNNALDNQTNPKLVADIYQHLLNVEKVDVVVGGYGDNSIAPAMPLIMECKRFFLGLMAQHAGGRLSVRDCVCHSIYPYAEARR